ncbi:MAG: multi-sensor hybrid histidine kinase [Gemmatimonadetes bacterium]|nr:multi-sensor hybrid histidine kinase [Gemmatimonadota bacterium]
MTAEMEGEIASLRHGDHVCLIVDSRAEQLATAAAVMKDGLARDEHCVLMLPDAMMDATVAAIAGARIDVAREERRGALRLATHRESYLRSGRFDPRAMIGFLSELQERALASSFRGLRLLGEMSWAFGPDMDNDRLVEYEALLNDFVVGSRTVLVCQYYRPTLDPALVYDVLRTHPVVILGGRVCPNPYYEPPELVLHPSSPTTAEFKRRRVDWWISQLLAGREADDRRKRAEQELTEREERIRLLLDSTAEGIFGVDGQGLCTFANRACARLLGYADPAELEGRNMHALMHHTHADGAPYREEECRLFRAYREGTGVHADDEVFWRADGTCFPAEYFSHPMRRGETVVGAVVTFLDISQRRKLEEQLRQAQKMEAMGQLAGGVAHDFNNLLTVINGYSDMLLKDMPANDPARELVEEIAKAGVASASLTRQLLAFSRKQILSPKLIDVNDVVRGTERMLLRLIGEDVDLTTRLDPDLDSVMADPGHLQQVLVNLAVNARDAMPRGGRLTIETRNATLSEEEAREHPGGQAGAWVTLTVTDSGTGMTEEVSRRVFEPFFTTKGPGKGTGLGLAVVHGFVEQSGGHVEVSSAVGAGTTITIFLPRAGAHRDAPERSRSGPGLPGGHETILLVEDEEAVRALVRRILRGCGYTVLTAGDGDSALRRCAEHTGPIDLLVTDVVMPGMGGPALAEKLLELHPEMRVLYVSGYTDDAVVRHGVLEATVNFLQKPFAPSDLARKVREALGS